jgi:transitional endoplasmic reticulum ATPase
MPGPDQGVRPEVEAFEYAGCRVALVNPAEVLAGAGEHPVNLLRGPGFPSPVRQVRLGVTTGMAGDRPVHRFEAQIRAGGRGSTRPRPAFEVLGRDPLGVWLSRRVASGDPWATRIVDGIGNAAAEVSRRLGVSRPAPPAPGPAPAPTVEVTREDPGVGLRATVTYLGGPGDERLVTVRAGVPSETVGPEHLRAVVRMVLQVVAELVDPTPGGAALSGHSVVVGGYPAASPSDPESSERVTLDQVGGLHRVVAEFRQVAVSFQHPQVMARWGARRPQGILMYGPPGTGKTMLARALANEIGANLREIRTPEILDKWLGASERNIRRIFQAARRYREPTVLLFDEFDSIISYTGAGGDAASQAVNAVAGIFKQEMNDLIEHNPNVIVVATTNFPDRVDESLTRSGRFDVKIAIPLPDEDGRHEILAKMVRRLIARHEEPGFRMFAEDLDLRGLARTSNGMTGADLKEVLRRVRLAKAMQEAHTGAAAPISQEDLEQAILELRYRTPADPDTSGPTSGPRPHPPRFP